MNMERWYELFKTAGVDIEDTDSYSVVVSRGPLVIQPGFDKALVILTPEQVDTFNNDMVAILSNPLDSDT